MDSSVKFSVSLMSFIIEMTLVNKRCSKSAQHYLWLQEVIQVGS